MMPPTSRSQLLQPRSCWRRATLPLPRIRTLSRTRHLPPTLIPRLRRSPWLSALLDGVVAASLGLMAAVTVDLARQSIVDVPTVLLLVVAAVLLIRFRVNSTWLIVGGAVAGLALSAVHRTF